MQWITFSGQPLASLWVRSIPTTGSLIRLWRPVFLNLFFWLSAPFLSFYNFAAPLAENHQKRRVKFVKCWHPLRFLRHPRDPPHPGWEPLVKVIAIEIIIMFLLKRETNSFLIDWIDATKIIVIVFYYSNAQRTKSTIFHLNNIIFDWIYFRQRWKFK